MKDLILLHGAIGAKDQLETLGENLKDTYTIHNLNFSGHGGEPMPETYTIECFADDVLKYMDQKQISSADIFGYSMGGYVALYIAKKFPEKVKKIFTLGTKFLWNKEIAEKEIKMLNADKIMEKLPAFAETLQNRHRPNDWKIVLEKTAKMMTGLGNKNVLALEDFRKIAQPVTISIGDKDTMVTLEETINVYRNLQHANLIVFPNTQHPIERVNTERLNDEIVRFFNS